MWCANLQQVFRDDPSGKKYQAWVLLLRSNSETMMEREIAHKHQVIEETLREQGVLYSEITTHNGKKAIYDKFNHEYAKHPVFIVCVEYPLALQKGSKHMVIEWGKWPDVETLKADLMAFVDFFSDVKFRDMISHAYDTKAWKGVLRFLKDHGLEMISTGATVASVLK